MSFPTLQVLFSKLFFLSGSRELFFQVSVSILLFILLLVLSACTSVPQSETSLKPLELSDELPNNWRINGRISIINEQENWYAKFNWIQKNQDFQLSFTGPLGETELQVSQIAQNVRLKTPAKELSGHNLEQLVYQETGWELPVSSLRYWIQGKPNPEINSQIKYNKEQQIKDIFQAGWHIQYPKRTIVEPLSDTKLLMPKLLLPKKVIATRSDVKIKIIITRWDFDDIEEITH